MKFHPANIPEAWVSECGRYRVWLRARHTDGQAEYSACSVKEGTNQIDEWVVYAAPSRTQAIERCKEHAQRLINIL